MAKKMAKKVALKDKDVPAKKAKNIKGGIIIINNTPADPIQAGKVTFKEFTVKKQISE